MRNINYKKCIRQWRDQMQETGYAAEELDRVLSTIDAPVWSFTLNAKFLKQIQQAVDGVVGDVQAEFKQLLTEIGEE